MKRTIATLLLAVSSSVSAQDSVPEVALPLALQYQLKGTEPSPGDICNQEMQRAAAAVGLRDKGKTKDELAAVLPKMAKTQPYMAWVMASILDDVYAVPAIKKYPYFAYRSASCFLRAAGKPAPKSLSAVSEPVLACQAKFGEEPSDPYYLCIQEAVAAGAL